MCGEDDGGVGGGGVLKLDVPESDVVVDVFAGSGDGDVEVGRVGGLLEGDAVGDGGERSGSGGDEGDNGIYGRSIGRSGWLDRWD